MSMQALLVAVTDRVRRQLGYTAEQCAVRPDGAPDPASGEVFVAVHPLGFRNTDDGAHRLDEEVEVGVTLTMRSGWLPVDRFGPELVAKDNTGLYARAEAIRALCHMDYTAINNANTAIGAGENGFVEPLKFRSCSAVRPQLPVWFSAEGTSLNERQVKSHVDATCGMSVELTFGGARRVQTLEEQS